MFMPTTLGTTGPRRRPCLRTSPLRAGTQSLWASDNENVVTMSAMRSDLRAPAAVGVASLSVLAAGVVVVLLPGAVVHGPWGSVQPASVLSVTACLLAVAAVSTSLGLLRAEVGWHADGAACAALAVCLAGAVLNGYEGAGDMLRVAGGIVAPAMAPVALSLVERRVRRGRQWAAAGAASVVALAGAPYLVRDPFHDVACWSDCAVSYDALLPSDRAAELLPNALAAVLVVLAVVALALLAVLVTRVLPRPTVGTVLDLLVATAATAAASVGALVVVLEDREVQTRFVTLLAVVLAVLGILVTCQPALVWLRRRRIRRLAEALGDLPRLGTLEASLARALGDPEVRVAYWLPESGTYVGADGRTADTSTWPVTLVRDGRPLAAVQVGRHGRDAGELAGLIGPAARLAVDSERQQAELRLQLAELRASRQRIVEVEDETRRRIERDLHDVVQAELLGTMFDLSLVEAQARRTGDRGTVEEATGLRDEVRGVVATVRGFAQGVHPAALDSMGLPAALEAMAQDARVVITVDDRLQERPPRAVEQVIYRVVHDAAQRATAALHVRLEPNGPGTVLQISGYPAPVPQSLSDRAGALGGTLEVDGDCLTGTLP